MLRGDVCLGVIGCAVHLIIVCRQGPAQVRFVWNKVWRRGTNDTAAFLRAFAGGKLGATGMPLEWRTRAGWEAVNFVLCKAASCCSSAGMSRTSSVMQSANRLRTPILIRQQSCWVFTSSCGAGAAAFSVRKLQQSVGGAQGGETDYRQVFFRLR